MSRPADEELRASDPSDFSFMNHSCDGEVATTTKNYSFENLDARELRSMCVDGNGKTEKLVNKIDLGSATLYTILEFRNIQSTDTHADRD